MKRKHAREGDVAYRLLNAAAHARSTPEIEAPALVCHLAIWCDRPFTPIARESWRHQVDVAIAQTIALYKDRIRNNDAVVGEWIVLFNRICSIHAPDRLIEASKINDDERLDYLLSADLRAITLEIDLDCGILNVRFELHSEYCSATHFFRPKYHRGNSGSGLNSPGDVGLAFTELASLLAKDRKTEYGFGELEDFLYKKFWTALLKGLPFYDERSTPGLGFRFADFRGVIICDQVMPLPCEVAAEKSPAWGALAADHLKPLIGATAGTTLTASYMLDGRAFYMTTLAPPSLKADAPIHDPLQFVMYVHHHAPGDRSKEMVNFQQLGRLVDRLFLLGTVRLAALTDLAKLRSAGRILANFEPETRKARVELDKGNEYESEAVVSKFYIDVDNLQISGGLEYRVERSRYYVEEFRNALGGLRIGRVEGYQPYDKFVQQRLGARYDFIDRLGRRYERAVNSTFRLTQANLSLNLNNIQKFGEVVILFALLPYYLNALVEHVTQREHMWRITSAIWAVSGAVGLFRLMQYARWIQKRKHLPSEASKSERVLALAAARVVPVVIAMLLGVAFYFGLCYLHDRLKQSASVESGATPEVPKK